MIKIQIGYTFDFTWKTDFCYLLILQVHLFCSCFFCSPIPNVGVMPPGDVLAIDAPYRLLHLQPPIYHPAFRNPNSLGAPCNNATLRLQTT